MTKICAVVVTYNRKDLLIECLEALRKQTKPLEGIYIIDNASTDFTPNLLIQRGYIKELPSIDLDEPIEKEFIIENLTNFQPIKIHYVRMNENTGGAGGFYEGVKRGYERGYDWLWLMDDDTIATSTALENWINKLNDLNKNEIGFLCSKVLWNDGSPHIMNIPCIKALINGNPFNLYEEKEILLVESASFVSLLISREIIQAVGLPIKEFYIWGDDVEYTLRISKSGFKGFYVKESIVIHKTKTNYSASGIYDWRFYYNVRNWLWIYKLHYKKKYIIFLIKTILYTFRLPYKVWFINIKACVDSIFKNPEIEFCRSSKI